MRFLLNFIIFTLVFNVPFISEANEIPKRNTPVSASSFVDQQWLKKVLPLATQWLKSEQDKLALIGRGLNELERSLAGKMGVNRPDLVRIIITNEWPMPTEQPLRDEFIALGFVDSPDFWAMTLGYAIVIKPQYKTNESLLSHELVHVAQFEKMTVKGFLKRYLYELKKLGYEHSTLEIEAYGKQI